MVRRTSINTFHQITGSGLLSKRRMEVYRALYEHGPATASELWKKMGAPNSQGTLCSPRLNEMRAMGVVYEVGTKVCSVTGKVAIEWDVTDALPVKPPKKETLPEKVKRLERERQVLVNVVAAARSAAQPDSELGQAIAAVDALWSQG